jgi:hypothetical protein
VKYIITKEECHICILFKCTNKKCLLSEDPGICLRTLTEDLRNNREIKNSPCVCPDCGSHLQVNLDLSEYMECLTECEYNQCLYSWSAQNVVLRDKRKREASQ